MYPLIGNVNWVNRIQSAVGMQLWYSVFGDSLCFAVMADQSGTTNVRIAERFEAFCDALKRIEASYVRTVISHVHQVYYPDMDPSEPYLLTHLSFVIPSSVTARTPTRSGVFSCTPEYSR